MGGLLIADTLLEMFHSRPDKDAPLWPKIIAVIAYDTPVSGTKSIPQVSIGSEATYK